MRIHQPLRIPERNIAVPTSISAEAAAVLGTAAERDFARPDYPHVSDVFGWLAYAAAADANMLLTFGETDALQEQVDSTVHEVQGSTCYELSPVKMRDDGRVLVHIHGGALIAGGGKLCRISGATLSVDTSARVYAVDYRMPPRHPFPVPLDDCVAAYAAVLDRHSADRIVVHGNSAGANLATAMLLRAEAEGLAMPAALILETPELDLTESGDTFETNRMIDTVLQQGLLPINRVYAGNYDLADPYLSPLFGSFKPGSPRTLLTAGTRDMFLSNAVRMLHRLRDAEVSCELLVYEAMPRGHGGFFGTPEDGRLRRDVCRFAEAAWSA